MNSTTALPHGEVRTKPASRSNPTRYLYASVSALLFVLMFLGFQQFYLHGQDPRGHGLAAPVKSLLIVHGTAMTTWMLLFFVQPLLIASNNRRLHMSLGGFGAVLAAFIVVLGAWTAIAMLRVEPDMVRYGLHNKAFLAIPLGSILVFGLCVAIGVWNRRRAEIHRPMMLLATLAIIGAATSRITGLRELYASTVWGHLFGPYFPALVVGVVFLAVKTALTRSFDRWLAGSLVALVAISALIMKIAPTAAWERFANFLAS